ncbi:MAG: YcxB family protein [Oscillospiraceae bacterium]|nr:YcxB family protein [Oscillospiraceae bacterium]
MGLLLYELVEIIPFLPWLSPFSSMLSVITVGIAIFGLYRIVFGARIYARKIEKKRIAAVGDRTVFAEILFNDTYFCYCSAIAMVQSSIAYTEVEALRETENYYLVFLRSGNDVYFFSKNGFVQGTLEQALQLLGRR